MSGVVAAAAVAALVFASLEECRCLGSLSLVRSPALLISPFRPFSGAIRNFLSLLWSVAFCSTNAFEEATTTSREEKRKRVSF